MAGISQDFADRILDWLFGGSSPTRPTGRYLHLYTGTAGDEVEVTTTGGSTNWTNYARGAFTGSAAANFATDNAATINYGTAATDGTVNVTAWAAKDQAGNVIYGPVRFATAKPVTNGDPVSVAAGDLDFSITQ